MELFAKRVLTVLAALLVLTYVGYQIFMATYTPVKVETAELCDEYETIDTKGYILRSESMIAKEGDGYVYYIAENGMRVAKDGRIAEIYADAQSAANQQTIKELDGQIKQLMAIQDQGQNSRTSLDLITTQLKQLQSEVIFEAAAPAFYNIDELSEELLILMNKKQATVGNDVDFSAHIMALQNEKDSLSQTEHNPTGVIRSPIAGYFVSGMDGYEAPVDPDKVLALSVEDVRALMDSSPSNSTEGYIGKVVGSYEWYLACVVSSEDLTHLSVDRSVRVRLPMVSGEAIPVTLVAQNRDRSGEVAVIFRCDYMSASLSDIRMEDVQILVAQHSGLKVPDEAVRFNEAQESGVFVKEGNMIKFRRIQVLHHSHQGSFSICAVVDDDNYLQLYDDIVMEGKNLYDGKIVRGL